MPKTFNVVLTGKVSPGHTRESVAAALAKVMRLTEARSLELLSGKETVVKGNLDQATLARYLAAFKPTGAEVRADPVVAPQNPAVRPPAAMAQAAKPVTGRYGGFWIRLLALVADVAILFVASFLVMIASAFLGEAGPRIGGLVVVALPLLYWPLMQASGRQATYGKAMLGLKVADGGGERVSLLRSFGREIAKLLSLVPLLIGFLIAAFTARKQALHDFVASTLVLREGPAHVAGAITVAVVGIVGPMIAIPMFFMALFMGMIAAIFGDFVGAMKKMPAQVAVQAPAPRARAPSAPARPATPAPAAPAPAAPGTGDAEFDRLMGAPLTGFEKPGTTRAGPAILELSTMFSSSFWIKVYLPRPPNADADAVPRPRLIVERVLDQAGNNHHDPDSMFEKGEFFQRPQMTLQASPVAHLSGLRSVHVRPGLTEQALHKAEGRISITLPVDAKVLSFDAAELGKEKTAHDAGMTLVSVSGGQVRLRYRGVPENYLTVRAFAADGKPVPSESRQVLSGKEPAEQEFVATFKGTPARIETVVAARFVERSFPFSLAKGAIAASR